MFFLTLSADKGRCLKCAQLPAGLLACVFLLALGTCAPATSDASEPAVTAEAIIERSVIHHGMERFDSVLIELTFRDHDYAFINDHGRFAYMRMGTDSLGAEVHDLLTNQGLERIYNGDSKALSPKDSAAYASSVNSVRYFFMLPYSLLDPAVNAELLDSVSIEGVAYDCVRITFDQEGGGTDFDDVYHYFFRRDSGALDYLAYTFEVDGGGLRFRKAVNQRRVDGVLVQDYLNFGVDGPDRGIDSVAARYTSGELPQLSVIENTEVQISDPPAAMQ